MFWNNQRVLCDRKGGKEKSQDPPNIGETRELWKKLWDKPVDYNTEAEWLKKIEEDFVGIDI